MRKFVLSGFVVMGAMGFAQEESSLTALSNKCTTKTSAKESTSLPSVYPKIQSDIGLSFGVDFLYWQASQTGMTYASIFNFIEHSIPLPGGNSTGPVGSNECIHFSFDPGVRVAAGIRPRHDEWQIDFLWTHLTSTASGATNLSGAFNSTIAVPYYIYNIPQLGNNGVNASAYWSVKYNTLDLDITRPLPISDSFGFRLHLGLRNLWLNQNYNILSINTYNSPTDYFNAEAKAIQHIWGIGPMLGFDSLWNVYRGFALFGKAMFSMIWSNVHSTNISFAVEPNPPLVANQLASFHTVLPNIDFVVGGQYDWFFSEHRYHLGFNVGWELQTLFSTNFLGASYNPGGDFNLSGLTTGLKFDF